MDWGIVVSVLVALALFFAAAILLAGIMISLMVWRFKSRVRVGGNKGFEFPCCSQMKSSLQSER